MILASQYYKITEPFPIRLAEVDSNYALIDRSALPTAPKASRGANIDLSLVPQHAPYTAFLGNLPFEVSNADIERFFSGLKVFAKMQCVVCMFNLVLMKI